MTLMCLLRIWIFSCLRFTRNRTMESTVSQFLQATFFPFSPLEWSAFSVPQTR